MMFAVAITLLIASANAQTSSLDSGAACGNGKAGPGDKGSTAGCATCDEDATYKNQEASADGFMCGTQLYDPANLRCCGGTLRARAVIEDFTNKDTNINRNKNSEFCYGDKHVSSAEMVCGGEIVAAGEWDADGDITKINGCCNGASFVAAEYTYTKNSDTNEIEKTVRATANVCCGGTVQALNLADKDANDNQVTVISECCGDTVIDTAKKDGSALDKDVSVCCSYRQESKSHPWAEASTCCGLDYVKADTLTKDGVVSKDCACTGAAVDKLDSKNNVNGFCCNVNERKAGTWVLFADAFESVTDPKASTDEEKKVMKVWTAKGVCGCDNTLDTSILGNQAEFSQQVAGSEANIFQIQARCTHGSEDEAAQPCPDAQALTGDQVACCAGKPFLKNFNAVCKRSKGPVALAKELRDGELKAQADYDAQDLAQELVAGNPKPSQNFNKVFSDGFSTIWYNKQATGIEKDGYCGASSAQAVVASVAALAVAMLAL